jgi:hypothetical protein
VAALWEAASMGAAAAAVVAGEAMPAGVEVGCCGAA